MSTPNDPATIGPYTIVRRLGEGGMGIVYEARQTEGVRRPVALKVLRSEIVTKDLLARFAAERQALALMDHPGIAKVFRAGTSDDGRPYFAMELVSGTALTDYADAHRLDVPSRVRLFLECCRAVHHAHQKGVIHRDLKPSNILVTTQDGAPLPKIIDFGVAKAMGERLVDETLVTRFGDTIGTPAYMSPEQADGTNFDIDTRTDVYSLGVILYELLVGCLPIDPREVGYASFLAGLQSPDTDTPTPSARFTTLDGSRRTDSARLRNTSPARLHQDLSGDLDWIVMTALERDRDRRYDSALAFAEDLERYLADQPVSARPPSRAYRFRKFVRRHRAGVAAASVAVLALAAGTVATTVGFVRASREAATAQQVSDLLTTLFEQNDPTQSRGDTVTLREVLDRAAVRIDSDLAGDPLVQGRLMQRIGGVYRSLGLLDRARPMLEEALARLTRGGADPLEIAQAQHDLGYMLVFSTDYDSAQVLLRKSLATTRARLGYGNVQTAQVLNNLAFSFLRSGRDVPEGEAMLRAALPAIRAGLGDRSESVALTMYHLCWSLYAEGRMAAADSVCTEDLALWRTVYPGAYPNTGYTLGRESSVKASLAHYDEALALARQRLDMNRRLYPPDHPETSYALESLAAIQLALGMPDSALHNAAESVAMMRRVVDSTNSERMAGLLALGDALTFLRRFDDAKATYDEALAVATGKFGEDHPQVANALMGLGSVALEHGNSALALQRYRQAVAILRRTAAADSSHLADGLLREGEAAYRAGELDSAIVVLREARDIAGRSPGDHPLVDAMSQVGLARELTDAGRLDEACALADSGNTRLVAIFPPGHWRRGVGASVLGHCLVRNGRTIQGEQHLREGLRTLEATRLEGDIYRGDAARWLREAQVGHPD